MKKNRNSFFNEQIDYTQYNQSQFSQNIPNQNMMYQPNNIMPPMPEINTQSNFYAGPNSNMNMPSMNNIPLEDIESRLAKIERQLSRLEHRISKLEQNSTFSTNDYNNNVNDMYMV